MDSVGIVYVAGSHSDNVFQITPGGVITQVIDSTGAGGGATLDFPFDLAMDDIGTVYVTCQDSNNVLLRASDGTITQIIDSSGDGLGNPFGGSQWVAVGAGDVYASGSLTNNAFRTAAVPVELQSFTIE